MPSLNVSDSEILEFYSSWLYKVLVARSIVLNQLMYTWSKWWYSEIYNWRKLSLMSMNQTWTQIPADYSKM